MRFKAAFFVTIVLMCLALISCYSKETINAPINYLTPSPSSLPIIGETKTPSIIKQSLETTTKTPFSTLEYNDALEKFINFVEKNIECKLPCWLGIVPGKTEFNDAANKLTQFGSISYTEFSSERAYMRIFFPNFEAAIHDNASVITPASDGIVSHIWVYAGVDPKGKYEDINYSHPEYQKLWQRYFISEIFKTYDLPEKIFLDTTLIAADEAASYPFVIWIVYPQQGFLIRYQGTNEKIEDNIRICPMKSRIEITIWDVETSIYEDFMKDDSALGSISLGPQPIENVTDFSQESFYETFKNGDLDTCFDTQASIWPPN